MTTAEHPIYVRDGTYKGHSYEMTIYGGRGMFRLEYLDVKGSPRVKAPPGGWVTTLEGAIAAGHTMARDMIDD